MAEADDLYSQNLRETNRIPEPDPMAILTAELQKQASGYTVEALQMGLEGTRVAETLRTQPEYQRVAASSSVDDYYAGVVGPNAKVLSVFPKGTQVSSGGNKDIKQIVDPKSGETIVFQDYTPTETGNRQDDSKVMNAAIQGAGKTGLESFNLTEAQQKLKTLSGDALLDYVGSTIVNIDMELAGHQKRVRQVAALESGYVSARAAYERNLQLDSIARLPNGQPFSSLGKASAQTESAKALMDTNFTISERMAAGLLTSDSKIAELTGARTVLSQIEARRAQREARATDIKDAKADRQAEKDEALTAAVTPIELANYRTITGSKQTDEKDRLAIVQRRDKDKTLGKLVQATPDNIALFLVDTDKNVSTGALKLVVAYDKAANPNLRPDATTSPTADLIKKLLDNKKELVQFAPADKRAALLKEVTSPSTSKEMRENVRLELANLLGVAVDNQIRGEFVGDVRRWTPIANADLTAAITEVSATVPNGKVPVGLLVNNFISRKMTDPTGKPVGLTDRLAVLEAALVTGVASIPSGMFTTPESTDALRIWLTNMVKNEAARAFIRSQVYSQEQRESGMGFLYSRDFRSTQ